MIGLCIPNNFQDIDLLNICETETCTSQIYASKIISILGNLVGVENLERYFKVLITDQAPNMIKTGQILKNIYANLKHVSCLVHLLHNICEKICDKAVIVDKYIALLKKILNKNPTKSELFYSYVNETLPKFPILIRFCTWLNFTTFIFDNYNELSTFFQRFDEKNEKNHFEVFNSEIFEEELRFCYDHVWITKNITRLSKNNLSVEQQIKILKESMNGLNDDFLKNYVSNSSAKNPDIMYFMEFNVLRITSEEGIYNSVPLSSIEVERIFSCYNRILDDSRESFKTENLNMNGF